MQPRTSLFRARRSAVVSLLALPLLLAGCTNAGSPAAEPSPKAAALCHVHDISVEPESSKILLATHDGLDDATGDHAVKVSDSTIDLMGFTATVEPDVFYASGHPGPGSSLPNPAGLTVSGHTIVAFDDQLRPT
ncbi:hypothetical protein ACX80E_16635 [Arthrobacter sp. TMN-49]